jgi:predicted CDP-diglyceride synthetase/phosphatidate cytidylyltransferase
VGSRFDDWIYWTPLLQLHFINSSHIELLLDNESLAVFLLVLGVFSSLVSTTHGFSATTEIFWSELSTKVQFSQLLNTRTMNLEQSLTALSSNSLCCVPLYSQSLDAVAPSN